MTGQACHCRPFRKLRSGEQKFYFSGQIRSFLVISAILRLREALRQTTPNRCAGAVYVCSAAAGHPHEKCAFVCHCAHFSRIHAVRPCCLNQDFQDEQDSRHYPEHPCSTPGCYGRGCACRPQHLPSVVHGRDRQPGRARGECQENRGQPPFDRLRTGLKTRLPYV